MTERPAVVLALFLCIQTSCAFVTETTFMIGHKKYVERFEQPWFRVPHSDHKKVDAANVESSSFGKHSIPDGDVFIAPDWTPYEEKYLPCLDRKCICPYFNGTIRENDCVLKNGKLLKRAIRQEIRTLDDVVRKQFEDTVNWMKRIGLYNRIARVHKYAGVHSGPAFTLWHREFLKRFELVIRRHLVDPNMGVPYWDSTLDSELPNPLDSIIFTNIFFGETDENGFVVSGPYVNWTTMEGRPQIFRRVGENPAGELLSNGRVDWIVNNPDINMVLGITMPLTPMTNREALSNGYTDEMYEYAPRPNCSRTNPDCHSKYLFCHIPKEEDARCMSKVRIGGNCAGFENTEICYNSRCVKGLCQQKNKKSDTPKDVDMAGLFM
ncbi:hypothetical protein RB195_006935 [Necator americanus]|uniref:Tyrosinase copper-binding domain-containing protein n=1 Tax=Necator americanus TaxID=51031 RepID=A0ABR1BYI7_NECAM